MRYGFAALILGALLAGCGGDEAAPPPAAPPPPPPVAVTPPPAPMPATPAAPAAPKMTMAEMQTATLKSCADAINAHDAKKFAGMFAEDGEWNMAGMPPAKGRAEIEKNIQMWFDGFKDLKFSFSRAWMKNDMVTSEWGWTGTNSGEFMGMKATEKPAGEMGMSLGWFNDKGEIKKLDHYSDTPTILMQTGAVKGKARPVPTLATSMESWTAKGTPEEDKNVEPWKAVMAAFESKKEADFLGAITDDCEWNDMTMPESHKGKAEAKKSFAMVTKAFPDMKATVNTSYGVGDVAIIEYTMTGTQKGALPGIPAKNKPVTMHGIDVIQVKDGKMAKGWSYGNSAEMLMQLGVMKPPAAPGAGKPGDKPGAKPGDKPAAGGDKKPGDKPAAPAGDKKPADKKPEPAKK